MTALGLALLAVLGTPLFAIIAASALIGFTSSDLDAMIVVMEVNRIVDTPVLISIPLFTFTGYLMSEANTAKRLLDLSRALFGWLPGGLGIVSLIVCAVFTALTGASGVTIIALGSLLFPVLVKEGYPEKFSLGLVTSSGSLGLLFPPAIPLILYGIIANVSIDKLFAAGLTPGLLMILLLSLYCIRIGRKSKIPSRPLKAKPIGQAIKAAAYELPLPVIVLGGIYSGIFAVSEAAAVTAVYALLVEVGIYREVKLKQLGAIMVNSMTLVGGLMIILGLSLASTNYLIDQEVPTQLFEFIKVHITSKWTFLIVLNIFLLILGAILDIYSAIVLIVPLILPIALKYGIDPIHLGIVFLANMQIGYCTPPVGMNLFIASFRFQRPLLNICLATLPFLVILIIVVLIITYLPWLTLYPVKLLGI